uniref:Radical SAM core domain-containing protein n=1 Tax=Heterosigma akashiwo TaxID=2829 RepID=A0A7S3XS11_HETAK
MPYKDGRRTACISSQAGCAMGCVFCATGQMGLSRQLTAAEIVEQVYRYDRELRSKGERLSNIVFMGMGEPLNNYKNVMKAVRFINQDIGIGARHITISTVGLVPRIHKLAEEDVQIKLAISLHAANDEDRSALLPVNRRYNLNQLMDACENYIKITNRRITFEYALIAGENDTPQVAHELGRLLRRVKGFAHVNVIPLNPTAGFDGGPSQANAVNAFLEILNDKYKIPATPRVRRGIDIDAGCGQLKSEVLGKGF